MDSPALTFQNDITPFYYDIELEDLSIDRSAVPKDLKDNERIIMRSYANVTIVNERMEQYVFAGKLTSFSVAIIPQNNDAAVSNCDNVALLQAEVKFEMTNSIRME